MQLRDYQTEAIDSIYSYFRNKTGTAPIVVLPTGAGKSLVQAAFCKRAIDDYPNTRILCATHVQELIAQNAAAIHKYWPGADVGVYSAGLHSRQMHRQITVGGIQSIYKKIDRFRAFDLLIVDECHLMSSRADTMYGKLIEAMKSENPKVKVIGLTATPYRMKEGSLMDCGLFDGIAYSLPITRLIDDGYLSDLRSKSVAHHIDTTGVRVQAGDFVASELADRAELIKNSAVDELCTLGVNRRAWLVFCVNVDHALSVRDAIRARGISCETVSANTPAGTRRSILNRFQTGGIRAVTNVNVLSTGFDYPGIDLIGLMRPTHSAGLFIQQVGRGLRKYPGKDDALVLDWAGNIERFGPIDTIPLIPSKKRRRAGQKMVKECPMCGELLHLSVRECPDCGHLFPEPETKNDPEIKLDSTASNLEVLSKHQEENWLPIQDIDYNIHEKDGSPNSLRVTYLVDGKDVSEWVCFEHVGRPRSEAVFWWHQRSSLDVPDTAKEALELSGDLPRPTEAVIVRNGKYYNLKRVRFQSKPKDDQSESWPSLMRERATA